MYVTSSLVVKKTSSLGCRALNLLPPNIFPSSGGPSRSRTQTYGTNHLSICISLFLFNLSSSSYIAAGHHSLWRWPGHPSTPTHCLVVAAPPAHPAPEQVNHRTPLRLCLPPLRFVRSEVSTSSSALVLSPWRRRLSFRTWSAKQDESGDDCSSRG